MPEFPELLELRNKLWDKIRSFPGVVTVGIGSSANQAALVIFVDEYAIGGTDLPTLYENVPVVVEIAGKIKAHGD
jgi:hypothetical protein